MNCRSICCFHYQLLLLFISLLYLVIYVQKMLYILNRLSIIFQTTSDLMHTLLNILIYHNIQPYNTHINTQMHIGLHILGSGQDADSRSWIGFCESRVLGFCRFLEYLPLKKPLHFYPIVSRTDRTANSICYFVGFDIDKKAFVGRSDKNIYVDECTHKFQ